MTPKYNLALNRGETLQKSLLYSDATGIPVDLTSWTVESQIRANYTDTTASAAFTCSVPTPNSGEILIELPASGSLPLTGSCYLYDVRIRSGSFTRYILEGKLHVSPSVTR